MDCILLVIIGLCFFKGFKRGLLSMMVSLCASLLIFLLAYKLYMPLAEYFERANFIDFKQMISKFLNNIYAGEFASTKELVEIVSSKNMLFGNFVSKLLKNITFEGTMTAGQILSPTINSLICKVVSFVLVYIVLSGVFLLAKLLVTKITRLCRLTIADRLLGGVVGAAKGIVLFLIFYMVMLGFANFFLNEALLNFCKSGVVSNFLYDIVIEKTIGLFY